MFYLLLIRPPDIDVGGLMFYYGFFLLFFFSSCLISKLTERNSTKICYMLGSNCDLKMHV